MTLKWSDILERQNISGGFSMPSSFSAILVYMVKLKDVNSNLIKYVSKIAKKYTGGIFY